METPACYGQVFNIGNNKEITIENLAKMVRDKIDPSLEIEYIPYEKAYAVDFEDMQRRVPDLTKVHGAIGYEPTHDIEQTLDLVIDYFRKHEEAADQRLNGFGPVSQSGDLR